MTRIRPEDIERAQRFARAPTGPLGAWWNITTTRGRYTIEAMSEPDARRLVSNDLQPGEHFTDGAAPGPHATQQEAETA